MKRLLQTTARFGYGTTTLGHGDPSADLRRHNLIVLHAPGLLYGGGGGGGGGGGLSLR